MRARPSKQVRERRNAVANNKVAGKALPVVVVVAADERDQLLLGIVGRGRFQIESKQRSVPPSRFVIGEISDPVSGRLVAESRFSRRGRETLGDRRRERVLDRKSTR